jgi:hypothetical protein
MRSIEVHVLETDVDLGLAVRAGLLTENDLDELWCDECEETVGPTESKVFDEFSVVLYDDDTSWFLCASCSANVTERDTLLEVTLDFDSFVEGVDGMLHATFLESIEDDDSSKD